MKLKILIIDDQKNHATKLEENILKIYKKYKNEELLKDIEQIDINYVEEKQSNNNVDNTYSFYRDTIMDEKSKKETNVKLVVCLDMKLTKEDEKHSKSTDKQKIKFLVAKKIYELAINNEISVSPITSIPNFDEKALSILGTEKIEGYFSKETTVHTCNDYDLVCLIYFLANDKMPEASDLDALFGFD